MRLFEKRGITFAEFPTCHENYGTSHFKANKIIALLEFKTVPAVSSPGAVWSGQQTRIRNKSFRISHRDTPTLVDPTLTTQHFSPAFVEEGS
jgi:hypothetical protein